MAKLFKNIFEEVSDFHWRCYWFSKAIHLWVFIVLFSQIPIFHSLWGGQQSLVLDKALYGSPLPFGLDLLTYFPAMAPLFFSIALSLSLMGFLKEPGFIARFFLWYFVWSLDVKAWTALNGGNNIVHLTLLYSILMNVPFVNQEMRIFLKKISVRLIQVQFLILYLMAFSSKLMGSAWREGVALYQVVQIDQFHSNFLFGLFEQWSFTLPVLTYSTLIFQFIICLTLFIPRWRLIGISLGLMMHVGIAIHMNLYAFSLAMMAHYTIFLSKDDLKCLRECLHFDTLKRFKSAIPLLVLGVAGLITLSSSNNDLENRAAKDCSSVLSSVGLTEDHGFLVFAPKIQKTACLWHQGSFYEVNPEELDRLQIELGSISKLFTALLAKSQIENGLIDADSLIEISAQERRSLFELLEHQSGIMDHRTSELQLEAATDLEPFFSFSEKKKEFQYSNLGYVIAGHRLSQNSGVSFLDALREQILNVYGLDGITVRSALNQEKSIKVFDSSVFSGDLDLFLPAFGLVGTVNDLYQLAEKVDLKERLCSDEGCWGGYLYDGGFFVDGQLKSGGSLLYQHPVHGTVILASNQRGIHLKGALNGFLGLRYAQNGLSWTRL
jgi:hypothetical protein